MLKRLWYLFTAGSALDEPIKEKNSILFNEIIEEDGKKTFAYLIK